MNADSRFCVVCRVGVGSNHSRCPVCGGSLVQELPAEVPPAPSSSADLVLLAEVPVSWARDLSSELTRAGIPHAVEADRSDRPFAHGYTGGASCEVRVPADQLAEAQAVHEVVYHRQVPSGAEATPDAEPSEEPRVENSWARTLRFATAAFVLLAGVARCFGGS